MIYDAEKYAKHQAIGAQLGAAGDQKRTIADEVRHNAERAAARLSSLREHLVVVQERLCGSLPRNGDTAVAQAIGASGFIHGTAEAITLVHHEIDGIDQIIVELMQVI